MLPASKRDGRSGVVLRQDSATVVWIELQVRRRSAWLARVPRSIPDQPANAVIT